MLAGLVARALSTSWPGKKSLAAAKAASARELMMLANQLHGSVAQCLLAGGEMENALASTPAAGAISEGDSAPGEVDLF
jgi:hypothetical protein